MSVEYTSNENDRYGIWAGMIFQTRSRRNEWIDFQRRVFFMVISGNHELWDPEVDMDENIRIHREFFSKLGINYLQNNLLCVEDDALDLFYLNDRERKHPFVLNENEILTLSSEEIHERLCKCPLLILGASGSADLIRNIMR